MRNIRFRGKGDGVWYYGYLYEECGDTYIIDDGNKDDGCHRNVPHKVDQSSVGQLTCMKDKNGTPIWEGDIVCQVYNVDTEFEWLDNGVQYPIDGLDGAFVGIVHYQPSKGFGMYPYVNIEYGDGKKDYHNDRQKAIFQTWCEVVGNITDKPNFLKEVKVTDIW